MRVAIALVGFLLVGSAASETQASQRSEGAIVARHAEGRRHHKKHHGKRHHRRAKHNKHRSAEL